MAQIPNLLTASRTSHHSRPSRRPQTSTTSQDAIIQQTDDDAAGSRLSAVEQGYLEDDFAREFWEGGGGKLRRMPIINRGTYVRTTSIDKLVLDFINTHLETSLSTTLSSSAIQAASVSTPTLTTQNNQNHSRLHEGKVQIVSLGAGTDTRFFRLLQHHPFLADHLIYHEIDFPATTKKKIQVLRRTGRAREVLDRSLRKRKAQLLDRENNGNSIPKEAESSWQGSEDGTNLISALYNIHALDLRNLLPPSSSAPSTANTTNTTISPTNTTTTTPILPNLTPNTPTLLLSECCLTYLPTATSTSILTHFARTLMPAPTPLEIILYEPLHPSDAFGKMMSENLHARGIKMPGLSELEDLEAHGRRLAGVLKTPRAISEGIEGGRKSGGEQEYEDGNGASESESKSGSGFQGWTINQIWDEQVSVEEKERLRGCEMVDEEEEWKLLAGHYGVMRGWRR